MNSEDRCLSAVEQLELENTILKDENMDLKKLVSELTDENKEWKRVNEVCKTAIARWEAANAD